MLQKAFTTILAFKRALNHPLPFCLKLTLYLAKRGRNFSIDHTPCTREGKEKT